jgi:hypothetical protein
MLAAGATALPFAGVEPRLDGIDHHGRERHFLIERVLADALVKLDWEMNRRLAESLAVLGANARLFLRSATSGASRRKRGHGRRWKFVDARCGLELWFCVALDRVDCGRELGDDLGVALCVGAPSPIDSVFSIKRWSASGSGVVRVFGVAKLFIENFFLLRLAGGMENLVNAPSPLGRRVTGSEQDERRTA